MWIVNMIGRLRDCLMGVGYEPPRITSVLYRGYRIQPNPYDWMKDEWIYSHEDYDGPGDNRCGTEATVDACKIEIDLLEVNDE